MAMSDAAAEISTQLRALADPGKACEMLRFFKSGPGQYGEGDAFLGLTVPAVRTVARAFHDRDPASLLPLLHSSWHEERLCCLVIWVTQFDRAKSRDEKHRLFQLYWRHRKHVNNWDLVDTSAPVLVGQFLCEEGDAVPIFRLLGSKSLWDRRIAVLSSWAWTKAGDVGLTLQVVERLLADREDLIHKACGWMLREAMKVDESGVLRFIKVHGTALPRTTLRYAIERLEAGRRRALLLSIPTAHRAARDKSHPSARASAAH